VSGDRLYGVRGDLGLERQFLHAERLAFPHPFSGEPVEVESPLPADLAAALERARGFASIPGP
jgi:23S rRNA pseudouridine1911/1915/1917 synthase